MDDSFVIVDFREKPPAESNPEILPFVALVIRV
jgi:hypothetical protein